MVSAFWLLLCVHWPAFRNPLWLAVILPVSGPSYEEVFAFNDPPLGAVLAAAVPPLLE